MCLTSTICAKPITFMGPGIYGHELRNIFLHFQALRFIVRRPLGLQRKDTQQRSAKTKCVKPNTFMRQWPCTVACVEAELPRRYVRSQLLSCDHNLHRFKISCQGYVATSFGIFVSTSRLLGSSSEGPWDYSGRTPSRGQPRRHL